MRPVTSKVLSCPKTLEFYNNMSVVSHKVSFGNKFDHFATSGEPGDAPAAMRQGKQEPGEVNRCAWGRGEMNSKVSTAVKRLNTPEARVKRSHVSRSLGPERAEAPGKAWRPLTPPPLPSKMLTP